MDLFEEDNCRCGTCSSYFPNVTSLTQHISLVHNEVKSDDEFVVPDIYFEEFTESEAVVRDVFYNLLVNIKAITKEIVVEVCRNRWLHDIPPPYHKQLFEITGWRERERALRKRRIQMVLLLALISREKHLKHLKSQDNIINLKDQRMQPSRGNSKNVQRHQQSNR
ncbi:hypothetical protein Tco_0167986 [Tanacetum coccineum]